MKRLSKATLLESGHAHTIEYALWKTILENKPLHLIGVYHPPPSNDTTNATFIDGITQLLADRIMKYNNMVILGDQNIHSDDLTNTDSYIFNDTRHAFSFKQHVTSPTHKCSHILDQIFSKMNSKLNLHNCTVY